MARILAVLVCVLFVSGVTGGCREASSATESINETKTVEKAATTEETEAIRAVELTLGDMDGNIYTNEYFGIALETPDGWYVLDDEQKYALLEVGSDEIANGDELKKKLLEQSLDKSLPLLYIYEQNPLESDGNNSSLFVSAEKRTKLNAVFSKSPSDVLLAVSTELNAVKSSNGVEASYVCSDPEDITINGKEFAKMHCTVDIGDGLLAVYQQYYMIFIDDYAVGFVLTYIDDEQKEILERAFDTLVLRDV